MSAAIILRMCAGVGRSSDGQRGSSDPGAAYSGDRKDIEERIFVLGLGVLPKGGGASVLKRPNPSRSRQVPRRTALGKRQTLISPFAGKSMERQTLRQTRRHCTGKRS